MNAKQGLTILAVLLGLLLLFSGWWGWQQSKAKTSLLQENELMSAQLGDLETLKKELEQEIDSLAQEYEVLASENESLQGSLVDAESRANKNANAVRQLKNQNAAEVNNLRAEIQELLAVKAELEANIGNLQAENDSLRVRTGELEDNLSVAREENSALNSLNATIQEELKALTLANFKASAFQVELERKSSKVTARSGQARRIRVTFDLTNVPAEFHGTRTLYLVVTDETGTPIKTANPIQAQAIVNGQRMDLLAVKSNDVNIEANQRLSFTHDLEEKLRAGYYRASVFTDIGLLGATSFRLR
ncbi:MAG: hypothetical protein R2828_14025 [Saprospiraceae bacterium]